MSEAFKPLLASFARGRPSVAEADAAFAAVLDAEATPAQIAAFLTLSSRFLDQPFVLAAGARAMRARMRVVEAPAGAIDVCGTGGDGAHTLNVSTAVSFVVAACGVPVAKHGNRAASSRSGAADVLSALGVDVEADASAAFGAAGLAFLFAQKHHPALAALGPIRREIGLRTVFNVLGPLCNPAGAARQLVGVADPSLLDPVCAALVELGAEKAWVVHGAGGIDELSPEGASQVRIVEAGAVRALAVAPGDAGLVDASLSGLAGGDPQTNADALLALLEGRERGAYRTTTLFNAAAALVVAGRAADLREGAALAARAIDQGQARDALARLVAASTARPI